jgi:membrane complex biogenesis BtpA family protein
MIHLKPLPGSPGFGGSIDSVLKTALKEASLLIEAGFPALIVENFHDVPFFADDVPAETVASMTRIIDALIRETEVPVGVNVLRNDALSALGIAAATGAPFIRVNILAGTMYTDQGPIVGRAPEVMRKKAELGSDVEVWADVLVKHATPPPGLDARQATEDTLERGRADALIVSGSGTGHAPDLERLKMVREVAGPDVRIAIGSGAEPTNFEDLLAYADTLIVGSYTKVDGVASNQLDPARVAATVDAAKSISLI